VKRFLKVLTFLIVSLFLVVSGVDATLDHMTHSTSQNGFTYYGPKGEVIFAYEGNFKAATKLPHIFLHRTSASTSDLPYESTSSGNRWF